MSIVVKMDFPDDCFECEFTDICKVFRDWKYLRGEEPELPKPLCEGCMIVCRLPEKHGRLVDADAFEKDVSDALVYGIKQIPSEEGKQIFHVMMQEVLDNVKKRENIVPAERSKT